MWLLVKENAFEKNINIFLILKFNLFKKNIELNWKNLKVQQITYLFYYIIK